MKKFKTGNLGDLAYIDSFLGLIPCKVIAVNNEKLTVKITATRKAYKRGEILEKPHSYVIPRDCIYTINGIYRIRHFYSWVNLDGKITAIGTKGEY